MQKGRKRGKENLGGSNANNATVVTTQAEAPAATQGAAAPAAQTQGPQQETKREPVPWDELEFPLLPHTQMQCKWRDGSMRAARIVERRPLKGGEDNEWEYYIHYRGVDRRMDCWKLLEDFDRDSVVPPRLLDPMDPKYVCCFLRLCLCMLNVCLVVLQDCCEDGDEESSCCVQNKTAKV